MLNSFSFLAEICRVILIYGEITFNLYGLASSYYCCC